MTISIYDREKNLKHNQELFETLDKDPRFNRIQSTDSNTQEILDWLERTAGPMDEVRYNEDLLVAAVHNLGNKLTFNPPPAPPPPPSKPNPRAGLEPWQLPLRATEQQMRAATRDQLRDLVARRRAAGLE